MSELTKYKVLDDQGMDVLLAAIFNIVETNYVRRSTYESDIKALTDRLNAMDAFETYQFEVDPTGGGMQLTIPDGEDVDLFVNEDGDLILNATEPEMTPVEKALSNFQFDINEKGILYVTI